MLSHSRRASLEAEEGQRRGGRRDREEGKGQSHDEIIQIRHRLFLDVRKQLSGSESLFKGVFTPSHKRVREVTEKLSRGQFCFYTFNHIQGICQTS